MPTPSNLPRMSAEDEELMWDILDLTSLSNAVESRVISDLASHPETNIITSHGDENLDSPIPSVDQENTYNQGTGSPNISSQTDSILCEAASPLMDGIAEEWSFSDRASNNVFASGVPQIPDWMIFGDIMSEHL